MKLWQGGCRIPGKRFSNTDLTQFIFQRRKPRLYLACLRETGWLLGLARLLSGGLKEMLAAVHCAEIANAMNLSTNLIASLHFTLIGSMLQHQREIGVVRSPVCRVLIYYIPTESTRTPQT